MNIVVMPTSSKLHIDFDNVTQLLSDQELATTASLEVVRMTNFLGQRYIFSYLKFYFESISVGVH